MSASATAMGSGDICGGGQTAPGHQSDLGAQVLDGRHHRLHEEHRPQRREAVLRASLSVGSYP
jgi:hypothetical protein